MGWLSNLFGNKRERVPDVMKAVFARMQRLLDDDETQIGMLPEPVQAMIRSKSGCDIVPGASGECCYTRTNPIPVNGPIGELAYLSRLRTLEGERLLFHRIGSMAPCDVFEAASFSGTRWFVLFFEMYYPRKSLLAPSGLTIADETSQFSGFTTFCQNFPHDFVAAKSANAGNMLNLAYIPISRIEPLLRTHSFERPASHQKILDAVKDQLSLRLG